MATSSASRRGSGRRSRSAPSRFRGETKVTMSAASIEERRTDGRAAAVEVQGGFRADEAAAPGHEHVHRVRPRAPRAASRCAGRSSRSPRPLPAEAMVGRHATRGLCMATGAMSIRPRPAMGAARGELGIAFTLNRGPVSAPPPPPCRACGTCPSRGTSSGRGGHARGPRPLPQRIGDRRGPRWQRATSGRMPSLLERISGWRYCSPAVSALAGSQRNAMSPRRHRLDAS